MTAGLGTPRAVVNEGVYTGRAGGTCSATDPGKVEAIADVAHWEGYDLSRCYAYSDSVSDLPMLDAVGHPVAVNPDARLVCPPQPSGLARRHLPPAHSRQSCAAPPRPSAPPGSPPAVSRPASSTRAVRLIGSLAG